MNLQAVAMTLAVTLGATLFAQDAAREQKLQQAIDLLETKGDVARAMPLLEEVAKSADRGLAARGLLYMGQAQERHGKDAARRTYERIVRDFAEQKDAAAEARARLTAVGGPASKPATQAVRLVWTGQDAFGSVRGSISPDGGHLTFLDLATSGLAIRDLKEDTSRVLAQAPGGSMYYAVFSPDGRRVAYTWATRSGTEIQFDLRILPLGGDATQPRIVYRNEEMLWPRPFGWTPDGKHILMLRSMRDGTNQIALIGIEDGSARVLKSIPWNYAVMSLSPDGRFVAYESVVGDRTAPSEIFVIAADGSRETKVVEGSGINSSPLWTPDGSHLLFLTDRTGTISLWSLPMVDGRSTGQPVLVKADIGQVRLQGITRSGTLHYLSAGVRRANVYIADLDASMKATTRPAIVSERFVNSNSAPAWSPDGQQLAYLSARVSRGTVLVIRTLKTGEERDIALPKDVQTGNLVPAPRWFPDGRSLLAFGILARGSGRYYRVDATNGGVEILHEAKGTSSNGGLGASAMSPDGRTILYIASADFPHAGQTHLVQFDIATNRETILKSGRFNAFALSPDGTRVALHTFEDNPGACRVQVMSLAGAELRDVVRGCVGVNRLSWSANNELLYALRGNDNQNVIWRVRADGGEAQPVGISMPGQLQHLELSPDGRRLTFTVFDTAASEVWALENFLPAQTSKRSAKE
jgi:Tol biopolymer transport system component